jgi:glutamate N-acetyltransferase/amino-acid N-acetyltransferase
MMVVSAAPCGAAAVYTQNKVKGAPLLVTQRHIANGRGRAFLCNSGNANTCAPGGPRLAARCCELAAEATGLKPEDFIVASTGVIGQALPLWPFEKGIPALAAALAPGGHTDAATAIITTDTHPKEYAVSFTLNGKRCCLGGACKGSGMIHPNMATLLAFITTDAAVAPAMLQKALSAAVILSLNQISVDGDTSTNDMAAILANGCAENREITCEGEDYTVFFGALLSVLQWMARRLAADGEGATKLLECRVSGAVNDCEARAIARSIISSSLFKAAMFGADANWGRALCAIGYTSGNFPVDDISLTLQSAAGSVLVCEHSAHHEYSEALAAKVLAEKEICVLANMGHGGGLGTAWGCDLSYDYVKINGDYRS